MNFSWREFNKEKISECKKCPRFKNLFVPPVIGEEDALAVLAEAPGETEAEYAKEKRKECVLVGKSGMLENRILGRAGIKRENVTLVNSVMCYVEGNPKPTTEEVWRCAGLVERALGGVETVIALGGTATTRLLGLRGKKTKSGKEVKKEWGVRKWRGSVVEAEREISVGFVKEIDPKVVFKSGERKGQPKPVKKEAIVRQKKRQVVVTLHPAELLRSGRKAEELVVADHMRARRLAEGKRLIEVGLEVKTHVGASALAELLGWGDEVCVDVETQGFTGKVLCIGVAVGKDHAVVCPPSSGVLEVLRKYFGRGENTFIAHNVAFDFRVLRDRLNIDVNGRLWDTLHGAAYERPDIRTRSDEAGGWDEFFALDSVASRYPRLKYFNWKEDFRSGGNGDLWFYCGKDATTEWWIKKEQEKVFRKTGRLNRWESCLMPLLRVLMKMEDEGVRVNKGELERLRKEQERVLEELETKWRKRGWKVNWESPKALMELFYDKLGLKAVMTRGTKGKPGRRTFSKGAIDKLVEVYPQVEEIKLISAMRHVKKKLSKDLNLEVEMDGRVRFEFNLSGTFTGRLSSNAQQFPRSTKLGECKEGIRGCVCGKIRRIIIPDRGHEAVVVGDYNQIEARITALLAGEKWLIEKFEDGEFDYHTETAKLLSKRIGREVDRDDGKKANHALNYLMGVPGLMLHFGCDEDEAKEILDAMHDSRPKTVRWWGKCLKEVEENGQIETLFGRIMPFKPDDRGRYELSKIVAAVVQSTAWEVIANSMLRVARMERKWGVRLLMQSHDELVVSDSREVGSKNRLRKLMEVGEDKLGGWFCPVDVGVGMNWEDAKRRSKG